MTDETHAHEERRCVTCGHLFGNHTRVGNVGLCGVIACGCEEFVPKRAGGDSAVVGSVGEPLPIRVRLEVVGKPLVSAMFQSPDVREIRQCVDIWLKDVLDTEAEEAGLAGPLPTIANGPDDPTTYADNRAPTVPSQGSAAAPVMWAVAIEHGDPDEPDLEYRDAWPDVEGAREQQSMVRDHRTRIVPLVPAERSAWLSAGEGSQLKRCPDCGDLALEGEVECPGCGCCPMDDMTWRSARAPRERSAAEPEPCEVCGGTGTVDGVVGYVTRDMATDAGESDMEGMPYPGPVPCPNPECEGGFIATPRAPEAPRSGEAAPWTTQIVGCALADTVGAVRITIGVQSFDVPVLASGGETENEGREHLLWFQDQVCHALHRIAPHPDYDECYAFRNATQETEP